MKGICRKENIKCLKIENKYIYKYVKKQATNEGVEPTTQGLLHRFNNTIKIGLFHCATGSIL